MRKSVKLAATGAALGGLAWLVAPGRASEEAKAPFLRRNFAHRGLHTPDRSVPENSLAAFRAAVEAGYGIEMDIHLTLDDQLAVFHDDTLLRMCGAAVHIQSRTMAQLREYPLADTEERIPTLAEALAAVNGAVPIILELKTGLRNEVLCRKALEQIRAYKGPLCVESFDPLIVGWFKKNAPEILRGQLSCHELRSAGPAAGFALGQLLTNAISRPQFLAYGLGGKTLGARLCEAMGAMRVAWTSRTPGPQEENDAVIFEFYRPAAEY